MGQWLKLLSMNSEQRQKHNANILNPVCKQTYNSLPKIYGSGKIKPATKRYSNAKKIPHNCMSTLDHELTKRKSSKSPKISNGYKFITMSQPKPERCTKKHCSCFAHYQQEQRKDREKRMRSLPKKKIVLRPIGIEEPDDLESHHKILRKSEPIGLLPKGIFQQKNNKNARNFTQPVEENMTFQEESESDDKMLRSKTQQISMIHQLNDLVVRTGRKIQQGQQKSCNESFNPQQQIKDVSPEVINVEIQVNLSRDQIQEQTQKLEEQSSISPQPPFKQFGANTEVMKKQGEQKQINKGSKIKEKKMHKRYKSRIRRARYEQSEDEESEPEERDKMENSRPLSSTSSVSLSSCIIKGMKKRETQFKSLYKKQSSPSVSQSRVSIAKSVRTNGTFIVPQRDDYKKYLKNYKVMNKKHFSIKELVKKPLFTIVQQEEGVYFGQYQNNLKNGTGLCVTEKEIFEGTYENDIKIKGSERNIDGIYKGYFVNGKRQGYGTFQWNNGQIFQGNWHNGTKNGFGIWRSPKGDSYEGEWLNNRQHGSGRFKHKNSAYVGQFQNFLKHGHGEERFTNGDIYVGFYREGKPEGEGKYTWYDGSVYQGNFKGGVRCGQGRLEEKNGNIYEGKFENDFKHGKGILYYKSGDIFEGIFEEGVQVQGTLQHNNGILQKISRQ